jgi:excisionase family DNA binding protein
MQTTANDYRLVTLDIAIAPYRGVSLRTARNWIRDGRLPAARAGRGYLVDPLDVERLLAPTLRQPLPRAERESPTARAERQLREAGVDV